MNKVEPNKLIVILGPTATGKTRLAAELAKEFNGEIISADSRQVYRRMNIGTGKDYEDYKIGSRYIKYHLIDIVDPPDEFDLFTFRELFYLVFKDVSSRNRLPFLVGGTGLYIHSILKEYKLKRAYFNEKQVVELKKLSIDELKSILIKLHPNMHNVSDQITKERLIKSIIVKQSEDELESMQFNSLVLGVNLPRPEVRKRITERLSLRLKSGMIEEVEELIKSGVTFQRLYSLGLEYKFIAKHLAGELNYNDMFQKLNTAIHQFAKRQMTWYRKMEREGVEINWLNGPDFKSGKKFIEQFINP